MPKEKFIKNPGFGKLEVIVLASFVGGGIVAFIAMFIAWAYGSNDEDVSFVGSIAFSVIMLFGVYGLDRVSKGKKT